MEYNNGMNDCKLLKHSVTESFSIEYKCPIKGTKHSVKLINPRVEKIVGLFGEYYVENHDITFKCKQCGKNHTFRI